MKHIENKKQYLRKKAREGRDLASQKYKMAGEELVATFCVTHLSEQVKNKVMGFYEPIVGEIDPYPLMRYIHEKGARLALPCQGEKEGEMVFRAFEFGVPLRKNQWATSEPLKTAKLCHPEILFIPLLAVSEKGIRLGQGGGYYDRYIAQRNPKPVLVGLCFDEQLVKELPQSPHDVRLDMVLTPEQWVKFSL